jgi:hypothetical protein
MCGHIRTVSRVQRPLAVNAAEAQLEVASHLTDAQQQLEWAVQTGGDYLYLTRIRQ